MAERQAAALSAHSALRARVVENLKRNHPDAFATAERSMGMRMSDVEDDVLVSYLDALNDRNNDADAAAVAAEGVAALRQVLLRAGIPIPDGGDLLAWTQIVETHLDRLSGRPPATRRGAPVAPATPGGGVTASGPTAPETSGGGGLSGRVASWASPETTEVAPEAAAAPNVTAAGEDEEELASFDELESPAADADIEAILAEIDASKGAPTPEPEPEPDSSDDLEDLFDAPPEPAASDDGLDDLFDAPASSTAGAPDEPDDGLDDLFGGPGAPAAAAPDEPGGNLGDLFDGAPSAAPPVSAPDGDADDGLGDLFDGPDTPAAEPTSGAETASGPNADDDGLGDLFDDPPAAGRGAAVTAAPTPDDDGLSDLFDDPAPSPPAVSTDGAPEGSDLDDLFDDAESAATASAPTVDQLDDLFDETDSSDAEPSTVLGDLFAETAGDTTGNETGSSSEASPIGGWSSPEKSASTGTTKADTSDAPAKSTVDAATAASLFADPVRPQLVPTQRRRRNRGNRKTPRTRAVSADRDTPGETPSGEPVELDAGSRNAILAAVAIPRPVFIADLEAVAGGRVAVEAWEDEMRALKMKAPVRLIGGKPRHRALGALVIPYGELRDASTEFTQSWWADCMSTYTGGKLHELGVLLRRVGTQVASATFSENVAVLRLNTPRGLVGIVAVTGTELDEGGDTRTEALDELSKLVRERLALIAVLTTTADQGDVDRICDAVTTAAAEQQWPPTTPVVTSHSWEWDDTAGTTMKLLHGG